MPDPVPAVSVVIPVYNRAETIRAAIESVLRQTWTDFELLIVDDGSVDATMTEAATVRDPRIRLLSNPRNLGAAAARNTGIRAARGTWVAFQDSDDEWLPGKLEKQMARLTAPEASYVAAYCGMLIVGGVDDDSGAEGSARPQMRYYPGPEMEGLDGDVLPALKCTSVISTQTFVVRREILTRIGGFDEDLEVLEDWDCALRVAMCGPIAFVDEPLVIQRFSANSLTRGDRRRLESRVRLVEKHLSLLEEEPDTLALHHYVTAGGHRRLGEYPAARAALSKACALQPFNLRYRAMAAYVRALSLLPGR